MPDPCYPKNRPPQFLGKIRDNFNGTATLPLMSTPMKFFRFWTLKKVRARCSVRSLAALWAPMNTSATDYAYYPKSDLVRIVRAYAYRYDESGEEVSTSRAGNIP